MVVVAAMLLIMFFFIMFILFLKTLRSVIDDFIVNATSSVDDEYAKVPVSNDLSTYIVIIAAFTLIYYTMSLMTFQDITDLMNLPNIIRNMYGAHFILDVTILIYSAFFIGGFGPFLKKRK